jgi:integrase
MRKISFLVRRFLAWAKKCLKPSTVEVYRHYFRKFMAYHGDKTLASLKPCHLSEWAETWHQAQALKRLFNWAVDEAGLTKRHPFLKVKHPPKGQRKRIMGRKEMLAFMRATRRDLRCLLIAHRETFARPAELREATWLDVAGENPSLTTKETLESGKACIVLYEFKQRKKRRMPSAPRVILLSPRVCRLFLRLLAKTPNVEGPIFRTKRGKPWSANAVRCRFRRLRKLLGLKRDRNGENVVPYTFRHTGATQCSALGVRDRLLADILGHVETSTTNRYQHLAVDHLREAMQKIWSCKEKIAGRRSESKNANH